MVHLLIEEFLLKGVPWVSDSNIVFVHGGVGVGVGQN
jgi:hypothetical protein